MNKAVGYRLYRKGASQILGVQNAFCTPLLPKFWDTPLPKGHNNSVTFWANQVCHG